MKENREGAGGNLSDHDVSIDLTLWKEGRWDGRVLDCSVVLRKFIKVPYKRCPVSPRNGLAFVSLTNSLVRSSV